MKGNAISPWLWLVLILLLSTYVVYEHVTSPLAVDMTRQIERHERMIAGQSEFFNPWQYRILSAYTLEGVIQVYNALLPGKPDIIPYAGLHFAQVALIFILCLIYFRRLGVANPFLIGLGLVVTCYCMSTSVFQSDLSFNTYFDIAFYLAAALLIIRGNIVWIIPLTLLAALNRETSGFIPLMVLAPFPMRLADIDRRKVIVAAASLAVFTAVFFAVRLYYGFQPGVGIHGMTSPKDFFIFNITFLRMYPLLLGTLSIIPIVVVLHLARLPILLRHWFWLIIPLWFLIHFVKGTAMETRLFLVPQVLIFIPAFLLLIDGWYKENLNPSTPLKKEWIA
jgi:hypothetical protein